MRSRMRNRLLFLSWSGSLNPLYSAQEVAETIDWPASRAWQSEGYSSVKQEQTAFDESLSRGQNFGISSQVPFKLISQAKSLTQRNPSGHLCVALQIRIRQSFPVNPSAQIFKELSSIHLSFQKPFENHRYPPPTRRCFRQWPPTQSEISPPKKSTRSPPETPCSTDPRPLQIPSASCKCKHVLQKNRKIFSENRIYPANNAIILWHMVQRLCLTDDKMNGPFVIRGRMVQVESDLSIQQNQERHEGKGKKIFVNDEEASIVSFLDRLFGILLRFGRK